MARTPRKPNKKKNTRVCVDLGDLHPRVIEISKSFDLTLTATIKLLIRKVLGLEHVVGGGPALPAYIPFDPSHVTFTDTESIGAENRGNPAADV
jgi:hypothetical protein